MIGRINIPNSPAVPRVMSSSASVFAAYERFIVQNAETVGFVETLLQAGYNLTPARFGDNEVTSEGVYALVNLLTLYHDVILWKYSQRNQQTVAGRPIAKRVLPSWWQRISVVLSSITATELFIEVFFRSKGKHWNAIFIVELMRAFIRLLLLYKAKGSILVRQRVPAREKPTHAEEDNENPFLPVPVNQRETLIDWAREEASTQMAGKEWNNYWKAQSQGDRMKLYVPTYPQSKRTLGEFLYILRPVVYLLAMKKFGKKSWLPWLISFFVDYCSNKLSKSQQKVNVDEAEELTRRKMLWALYLVRSPFFEKVLCTFFAKLIPAFIKRRSKKLSGNVSRMIKGYRDIYFYTAGSD